MLLQHLIGSGKTCGFLLPAFHNILEKTSSGKRSRYPKVLVVAPTRELSMQIDFEAVKFANACGLKTLCVYGGSSKYPQLQALGNVSSTLSSFHESCSVVSPIS